MRGTRLPAVFTLASVAFCGWSLYTYLMIAMADAMPIAAVAMVLAVLAGVSVLDGGHL